MAPSDTGGGGAAVPPTEPSFWERVQRAWTAVVQVFIPAYKDPTDPGSGAPRG